MFSRDRRAAEAIVDAVPAGGSCINSAVLHLANPNLPFGGAGESGQGHYHGHFGFKAFSHERAVLSEGPLDMVRLFYPPPYRPWKEKLANWATKIAT